MLSQDKKGVSEIIGYLLLVVFTVILAAIVFVWLRSYVPSEALNCPDGTSVFIKESSFNDATNQTKIVLKNNGRFDVAGFFIHATNSSDSKTATLDISNYSSDRSKIFGNSIVYVIGSNSMNPGDTETSTFNIPVSTIGKPYSVTIIPVRYQTEDNRERFVSCGNAKTSNIIGAPIAECVAEDITITCAGRVCGNTINNCGTSVTCPPNNCGTGFFCDAAGQCISSSCTPAANPCGTFVCGTVTNGTCGQASCGTCTGLTTCNAINGQCESTIGNGVCDPGETCANEPVACNGQQAQCQTNYICQGGSCALDTSGVSSCQGYCALLGYGGIPQGTCRQEIPKCSQNGEVYQSVGDQWCTGGAQSDTCCCKP